MKRIVLLFLVLSSVVLNAQDKDVFSIGSVSAKPGEKVSGNLMVKEGDDRGSSVPITIIYGVRPGPVLTLNAGMHGTEYVPIIALQRIRKEIEPENLSGVLILVHIANVPSFQGRSVYSNPIDFKNLNREFPGKADGSFSERLAFTLATEVIRKSDYYIDLHGGEFNESLLNYLYFSYSCTDADLCKKSTLLGHAMGCRYLIPYDFLSVPDSLPCQFSECEAMRQGIPAISVELGDRGEVDPSVLYFAEKGIKNVLKTLGMLEGDAFVVDNPLYLLDEQFLRGMHSGIFYPLFDRGDFVTEGCILGFTTDYWGNRIEEFKAPYSGIILSIYQSPVVNKGDGVIQMAKVSDKFIE